MSIWEKTFASRTWGEYPPEELVRIVKNHTKDIKKRTKCLELGCGPGANAGLLIESYTEYHAIDISETAIKKLSTRYTISDKRNLVVGDFKKLPWSDNTFDFVCDNFSLYANTTENIDLAIKETARVLVQGGLFYSRLWGDKCYGLEEKFRVGEHTYDNLQSGPCAGFGVSTFTNEKMIKNMFSKELEIEYIQRICRNYINSELETDVERFIEEYIVIAKAK